MGLIGVGTVEQPIFMPMFDATVHLGAPLFATELVLIDTSGVAYGTLVPVSFSPNLCGIEFLSQAMIVDAKASGGLALSNGRRFSIGEDDDGPLLPQPLFRLPGRPDAIAAGDFDGDGIDDVVVGDFTLETLSVVLSRSGGDRVLGGSVQLPERATDVEVGDFDGDGKVDALALSGTAGWAHVCVGDGAGNLVHASSFPTGGLSSDMVVGDFDGDGVLDVAVSNDAFGAISLALGHGDGSFGLPFAFSVPGTPVFLTSADLNGDGDLDLAVAMYDQSRMGVLDNDGNGTFSLTVEFGLPGSPRGIGVGDFDGDGAIDVVTTTSSLTNVTLGDGAGGFGGLIQSSWLGFRIAVADLDGDGRDDLVSTKGDRIAIYRGVGDGTFVDAATVPVYAYTSLAVGNLDGRSELDLAVLWADNLPELSGVVAVFGHADELGVPVEIGGPQFEGKVGAAGDVDGDGFDELVVATDSNAVVTFDGGGSFDLVATSSRDVGMLLSKMLLEDVNGDGRLDVVALGPVESDVLLVLIGRGNGTFLPPVFRSTGDRPEGLGIGDLDGDGHLDIATGNNNSNDISLFLGDGTGVFSDPQLIPFAENVKKFTVVDLTGDGVAEVLTAGPQPDLLRVWNWSSSGMVLANSYPVPSLSNRIVATDVDFDGDVDVIVQARVEVVVFENLGGGALTAVGSLIDTSYPFNDVMVEDLDGDGVQDLIVERTLLESRGLSVYVSEDDLAVGPERPYVSSLARAPFAQGDFDGDGVTDLVVFDDFLDIAFVLPGQLFR
ncbi:FG-GAP repeat protein [Planctomycetes bacterium Pla163]|uniref:FG-GAP repeat protein n=1 Tax=Rohdeia mirabilis TaxID=2528008 RepID=A0A518CVG2_9BACT|nr:FG-GAP repeat protein [Planctomycetes bacterium Pla163]